jgi:shikimate dehydrogenase
VSTTGAPDRYAVVGHPVAHSRSPYIHARFAEATGQHLVYGLIDIPPGTFRERVDAFAADGGRGLNVTLPYKFEAFDYAGRLTERARDAGAVNTLAWQSDGSVLGDNTDGAGLVRDLEQNLHRPLAGRRVLLLGAGGAARGALPALAAAAPGAIVVANRTHAKAVALAADFADRARIESCEFERLDGRFDLVVNATAASIDDAVPPVPTQVVDGGTVCYDMMYGAAPTAFLRWAAEAGAGEYADGIGMLVEQAAESFALWRGVRPETGPVLAALRAQLAEEVAGDA